MTKIGELLANLVSESVVKKDIISRDTGKTKNADIARFWKIS